MITPGKSHAFVALVCEDDRCRRSETATREFGGFHQVDPDHRMNGGGTDMSHVAKMAKWLVARC
jgi:hypothetical protein